MISAQHGTEFTNSHFENIKKVYSIWICMNPPNYRENSITGYHITEYNILGNVKENVSHYDLITAVIICLSKDYNKTSGIIRLLSILLSNDIAPDDKKRILQDEFNIPMTHSIESEVSLMCNLSESIEQKGIKKEHFLSFIFFLNFGN